jgi:uncharacterized membrane protein YkvA (DUF1232 family)
MDESSLIEIRPAFPASLVDFKNYTGGRVLALIVFLLTTTLFTKAVYHLLVWQDAWWWPDTLHKAGYFGFHFFLFIIGYCIAWIAFDRTAAAYAMSIFSGALGLLLILSPLDMIPDIVPVVGALDDAVFGGGSLLLAFLTWSAGSKKTAAVRQASDALKNGDKDTAIRLLSS